MFRKMLILEAKDKEYLLKEISKLTKGGACNFHLVFYKFKYTFF